MAEARPLIEQYRRLVGNEPDNPRFRELHESQEAFYHFLNGLAMLRENRPEDAVKELESIRYKVFRLPDQETGGTRVDDEKGAAFQLILGQAYEAAREPEKAKDAYRQSAEMPKGSTDAWVALARLQEAGDPRAPRRPSAAGWPSGRTTPGSSPP